MAAGRTAAAAGGIRRRAREKNRIGQNDGAVPWGVASGRRAMRIRRILAAGIVAAVLAAPSLAQEWRGGKARIDGVVKNDKGEPIAGAKVSLRWGKSGRGGPDLTTDKNGRWSIFGLV